MFVASYLLYSIRIVPYLIEIPVQMYVKFKHNYIVSHHTNVNQPHSHSNQLKSTQTMGCRRQVQNGPSYRCPPGTQGDFLAVFPPRPGCRLFLVDVAKDNDISRHSCRRHVYHIA